LDWTGGRVFSEKSRAARKIPQGPDPACLNLVAVIQIAAIAQPLATACRDARSGRSRVTDLGDIHIGGRGGGDLGCRRGKSRTKQFTPAPRRPRIVGKAQRTQSATAIAESAGSSGSPKEPLQQMRIRLPLQWVVSKSGIPTGTPPSACV
jgi:hypothetical protein